MAYISEMNHLLYDQDERAAGLQAEALEFGQEETSECWGAGGTVEITCIDGFSIGLTPGNHIFVKLPRAGRRFVDSVPFDSVPLGDSAMHHLRATNGSYIFFNRHFAQEMPIAVVDKLALVLARKREAERLEKAQELAEPPADLLALEDSGEDEEADSEVPESLFN
jgi:hypothetical protein